MMNMLVSYGNINGWVRQKLASIDFFVNLCKLIELKVPCKKEESLDYLCMRSLLTTEKDECYFVNIERLGLFFKWFGSLVQNEDDGWISVFDIMKDIVKREWFFGDIFKKDCESLLASFRSKPGTFLVRLSLTEPEITPFTISKISKAGGIVHQRIYRRIGKKGYYIFIKRNGKSEKIKSPDLSSLIENVSSKINLKYVCPGRKYNEFFVDGKFFGYLEDSEDISMDNIDNSD